MTMRLPRVDGLVVVTDWLSAWGGRKYWVRHIGTIPWWGKPRTRKVEVLWSDYLWRQNHSRGELLYGGSPMLIAVRELEGMAIGYAVAPTRDSSALMAIGYAIAQAGGPPPEE